jgi:hypothetical protein
MGGGRPIPTFTLTPAIVGIGTNIKTKTEAANNITFFIQPPVLKISQLMSGFNSHLQTHS